MIRKHSFDKNEADAAYEQLNPSATESTTTRRSARIASQRTDSSSSPIHETQATSTEPYQIPAKATPTWTASTLKDSIVINRSYWAIVVFILAMYFYVMPPQEPALDHDGVLFRTWPEDIRSEHCAKAHVGRPLIQYVLMVDAGSMGSRIHAYKFNYCNVTPELESETFGHVEPGLSSFDGDAEGAAKSLDRLLDSALETVPEFLHTSTPVAVKATAGLRLLGEEKSNRILAAVRHRLQSKYPFPIIKEQGVAVMDGADEGVYAWVTVNYLLDRLNSLQKKSTVAILDLGGASTQVVFEPKVVGGHSVAQGEHRYPMNFNGNEYVLYQHSHLGYGLMMARSQINNYLVLNPISRPHRADIGDDEYLHPCLPVGLRQQFTTESGKNVTLVGVSDPNGQCRAVVEEILYKQKICRVPPCSFNGVHQPTLHTAVEDDIYAFSFFFDLTAPFKLGASTPSQEMTLKELEHLADRVCIGDENDFRDFRDSAEAMKELRKSSDLCMDLSYIFGLLEYGYGLPKERTIRLAKKLKGYETGWFVGASIAVLEERDWFDPS